MRQSAGELSGFDEVVVVGITKRVLLLILLLLLLLLLVIVLLDVRDSGRLSRSAHYTRCIML